MLKVAGLLNSAKALPVLLDVLSFKLLYHLN